MMAPNVTSKKVEFLENNVREHIPELEVEKNS